MPSPPGSKPPAPRARRCFSSPSPNPAAPASFGVPASPRRGRGCRAQVSAWSAHPYGAGLPLGRRTATGKRCWGQKGDSAGRNHALLYRCLRLSPARAQRALGSSGRAHLWLGLVPALTDFRAAALRSCRVGGCACYLAASTHPDASAQRFQAPWITAVIHAWQEQGWPAADKAQLWRSRVLAGPLPSPLPPLS